MARIVVPVTDSMKKSVWGPLDEIGLRHFMLEMFNGDSLRGGRVLALVDRAHRARAQLRTDTITTGNQHAQSTSVL